MRIVQISTWLAKCVTPNTMLLGDNKQIKDIVAGDRVIGTNGVNNITKTYCNDYNGKLVKIKARGLLPIYITPEHPILVSTAKFNWWRYQKNRTDSEFSDAYWKPAKE